MNYQGQLTGQEVLFLALLAWVAIYFYPILCLFMLLSVIFYKNWNLATMRTVEVVHTVYRFILSTQQGSQRQGVTGRSYRSGSSADSSHSHPPSSTATHGHDVTITVDGGGGGLPSKSNVAEPSSHNAQPLLPPQTPPTDKFANGDNRPRRSCPGAGQRRSVDIPTVYGRYLTREHPIAT